MSKLYFRHRYLEKIRGFYDEGEIIKVITGVRRCGKSSLLEMIVTELREKGISDENIVEIHLDKMRRSPLQHAFSQLQRAECLAQ